MTLFPFTPSDLAAWQWAETHHPDAATAIWQAKDCAYIRDCLTAIRRRQEQVEKADDTLTGFRWLEQWAAERREEAPKTHPESNRSNAQARKGFSGTGVLFGAAKDAAECTA